MAGALTREGPLVRGTVSDVLPVPWIHGVPGGPARFAAGRVPATAA